MDTPTGGSTSRHRRLRWADLTPEDRKRICNGVGGKGGWVRPPKLSFEADADHHDFGYWRGCTSKDRVHCDTQFLRAMMRDATKVRERHGVRRGTAHILAALLYYFSVRIFGGRFFYLAPAQRGFAELEAERRGESQRVTR